jgi:5'-methylthioadenosine phosphorylase
VTHIDFTEPYSPELRSAILDAGRAVNVELVDGGVYAATQGPRLETSAEIDRLERDGATLVGMTGMPEAALARELVIPYACISVVANYAAGRGDSRKRIDLATIEQVLREGMARTARVMEKLVEQSQ